MTNTRIHQPHVSNNSSQRHHQWAPTSTSNSVSDQPAMRYSRPPIYYSRHSHSDQSYPPVHHSYNYSGPPENSPIYASYGGLPWMQPTAVSEDHSHRRGMRNSHDSSGFSPLLYSVEPSSSGCQMLTMAHSPKGKAQSYTKPQSYLPSKPTSRRDSVSKNSSNYSPFLDSPDSRYPIDNSPACSYVYSPFPSHTGPNSGENINPPPFSRFEPSCPPAGYYSQFSVSRFSSPQEPALYNRNLDSPCYPGERSNTANSEPPRSLMGPGYGSRGHVHRSSGMETDHLGPKKRRLSEIRTAELPFYEKIDENCHQARNSYPSASSRGDSSCFQRLRSDISAESNVAAQYAIKPIVIPDPNQNPSEAFFEDSKSCLKIESSLPAVCNKENITAEQSLSLSDSFDATSCEQISKLDTCELKKESATGAISADDAYEKLCFLMELDADNQTKSLLDDIKFVVDQASQKLPLERVKSSPPEILEKCLNRIIQTCLAFRETHLGNPGNYSDKNASIERKSVAPLIPERGSQPVANDAPSYYLSSSICNFLEISEKNLIEKYKSLNPHVCNMNEKKILQSKSLLQNIFDQVVVFKTLDIEKIVGKFYPSKSVSLVLLERFDFKESCNLVQKYNFEASLPAGEKPSKIAPRSTSRFV